MTKHPHGCLMVFPRPEWEKFRERIASLPMSAQWWKRIFLGNAMDVEMDATGRVLISPELRAAALISKDFAFRAFGWTNLFFFTGVVVVTVKYHHKFKK